jgi:8-oxo-dGTP diphosphatase
MNIETPKLAVDVICYHPVSGKIALIERKYPPLGWAIPGGFVDVGETVEAAARREMKEELNVDLKTLQFLGVYSDPQRDPRRHVVSVAFVGIITDEPVAGDDAKNYQMVTPDHASALTLCFDHASIISDARKKGMIP